MGGDDNQPDRWPNRSHYLKAALLGGGLSTVLGMIPVINWLNIFFFCLVGVGGAVGVYWVQKKTGTVEAGEGAAIGALGGLVYGLFQFAVIAIIMGLFGGLALADLHGSRAEEMVAILGLVTSAACCMSVALYPMVGAVGGLIGTLIWPATPLASAGATPEVPAQPTEAEVAKRKRTIRAVLGVLTGCLGIMGIFCVASGYLAYLESRDPDDTAAGNEVVSAPLAIGERMVVEIEPTAHSGTSRYAVWLVADGDFPDSMYELDGQIGCRQNYGYGSSPSEPYLHDIYVYRGPDEDEPEWLFLESQSSYGSDSITCYVQINSLPNGVSSGRVVVTELSRPSDWF